MYSNIIRRATLSDAQELAALAERTFRETYSATNSPEDMEQHCRRSFGEAIQAAEIENRNIITLVAECQGRLAAYAQVRTSVKAPGCVTENKPGEIQRFYVAGEYQGRGVAQELMSAAIAALYEQGAEVAWLGVWERNPKAIAFYRKMGFEAVGEHIFRLGSDPQRDVVMCLPIQASDVIRA